jgi:hypothetical protein
MLKDIFTQEMIIRHKLKLSDISNTRFYLDLYETFLVLSFRQNLISIYSLDKNDFSCKFESRKFNLFHESKLVSFGKMFDIDKFYALSNVACYNESLYLST